MQSQEQCVDNTVVKHHLRCRNLRHKFLFFQSLKSYYENSSVMQGMSIEPYPYGFYYFLLLHLTAELS